MKKQIITLFVRWLANILALALIVYLGIAVFQGNHINIIIASLILAIINAVIRPLLVIISLPLITLTMGLFTIVINGILMYLLSSMYHHISFNNFLMAIVAGFIVGLVNYIVSFVYGRLSK